MKLCKKCHQTKDFTEFYRYSPSKDGLRYKCKVCMKLEKKEYQSNNPEKLKQHSAKCYKTNLKFRLANKLRNRLYMALKRSQKIGSAIKDLGCSIDELKLHLESKFKEGMTWENHGKWHIDHILPLSKVDLTNKEEFLKVVNYKNLQPLWAEENVQKSNKVR